MFDSCIPVLENFGWLITLNPYYGWLKIIISGGKIIFSGLNRHLSGDSAAPEMGPLQRTGSGQPSVIGILPSKVGV